MNTSINYKGGDRYGGNDRSNRFELLLKNHGKCSTLNQMVLDMFKLEQNKCVYIAYYLLKSIEKELTALGDSLKKESPDTASQDCFREFKSVVEKEGETVKTTMAAVSELVEEEGEYKLVELEMRRSEIIRSYL